MWWPSIERFLDPWRDMQRMQGEMSRLFSRMAIPFEADFPAINLWQSEHDLLAFAEMPGIDPKSLDISVIGDRLMISGVRELEELKEGESYHRQERSYGRFSRTLVLPCRIDSGKVNAGYEKGILRITLPRPEEDKPKKIQIKVQ